MSKVVMNTARDESRANLRKTLREIRNSISPEQRAHSALLINNQLNSLQYVATASSIAGYLVNDGEIDLSAFIQNTFMRAENSNTTLMANTAIKSTPHLSFSTTFSLPVLHPICKGHLLFLEYGPDTPLVKNRYNIDEPELACHNVMPTHCIDVILMPLVGFDNKGNRLGMGGGYYDRTLAFTRFTQQRPILIGIAHDEQEVDSLPYASWDIPLDVIVTPKRILTFSNI